MLIGYLQKSTKDELLYETLLQIINSMVSQEVRTTLIWLSKLPFVDTLKQCAKIKMNPSIICTLTNLMACDPQQPAVFRL